MMLTYRVFRDGGNEPFAFTLERAAEQMLIARERGETCRITVWGRGRQVRPLTAAETAELVAAATALALQKDETAPEGGSSV